MAFLFGGGTAPATRQDPAKEYQRDLRHAQRSMDREDQKAAAREKLLLTDIMRQAKERKLEQCKTRVKELIRLRGHRARMSAMKGHMTSLGQQLASVQSAQSMQAIMGKTARLLQGLNKKMDAKGMHRLLMDYERQTSTFTASQEVVEETLDSMFETDGEQEATDDAMRGVFEELGLDLAADFGAARAVSSRQQDDVDLADIEARLNRLRTA
jgi:division protein CdvB (Snf7/Vps24/ESCRT-III family)